VNVNGIDPSATLQHKACSLYGEQAFSVFRSHAALKAELWEQA
jgi:hypothetical protein